MKTYKLEIEQLSEDGRSTHGYWSKGHHADADFFNAIDEYDTKIIDRSLPVERHWWRWIPNTEEAGELFGIEAQPHTRGAFPVTTVETT